VGDETRRTSEELNKLILDCVEKKTGGDGAPVLGAAIVAALESKANRSQVYQVLARLVKAKVLVVSGSRGEQSYAPPSGETRVRSAAKKVVKAGRSRPPQVIATPIGPKPRPTRPTRHGLGAELAEVMAEIAALERRRDELIRFIDGPK
jgi:hypothetical protein